LPELHYLLRNDKPDVLCITESWLQPCTPNSLVVDNCHYTLFRTDRLAGYGGVCILTNDNCIKATLVQLPSNFSHLELCTIDILLTDANVKLRLFVCYRPPSSNYDVCALQYVTDLCDCIDKLFPVNSPALICGDFNLPMIDWSLDNCSLCSDSTCSGIFLDFYYNHGLCQCVTTPTRYNNVLDLIFTNDINCVLNVGSIEPFSTSDHNQVCFDVPCNVTQRNYSYLTRNFIYADWSGINAFLSSTDWFELFHSNLSAKSIIDNFYNIIDTCIEQHVPCKYVSCSRRYDHSKYPLGIRRLLRKKAIAWRANRVFKTPESMAKYKSLASKCKYAIREFVKDYETHLVSNENIGAFFRYANKKFSCKSAVGPLQDEDGALLTDPECKADLLQRAFVSNYNLDNGRLPSSSKHASGNLSRIYFSPALVRRAIKKLNVNAKGGPDGIPPAFFSNCCEELSYPLSLLFTLSFEHSIVPDVWLKSFITPIFKKGNPCDPTNYRPISLTATICKLMETIIKDQLVQYLVNNGLLNKHQHAFIKNHSTATNLLESINDWLVSIKSPNRTDVVYIDFSKAFDSIVTSKLLYKLESYGVTGLLLKWIECFLSNRIQCVVLDHTFSPFSQVVSGVPQGSVLGPILFLLYINDIESVCCGTTKLQLFADDAKLYSSINIDAASVSLQQSLDNLAAWSIDWQLVINISKCAVLSVSTIPSKPHVYYINGTDLSNHSSCTDLGVVLSEDLSFHKHINSIVSKARFRVSILFRGFISRDHSIMRRAFIAYIRPILEYNSVVWSPSLLYLIEVLESVQRSFSKRLPSLSSLTYAERLAVLNLETLELRRLRFDLIFYYKVFNHLTPFDPDLVFTIYSPPNCLRSNEPFILKPITVPNRFLSTTFCRAVDAWNYLPLELRLSKSLPVFKRGLKVIDFSKFLKGSANLN
jgi:hypothetical protein